MDDAAAHSRSPGAGCTCVLLGLVGDPPCGEPIVAQVITGCVNEHLDEGDTFCDRHLQLARDGMLWCSECWPRRERSHLLAEVRDGEVIRVLDEGPLTGS